MLRASSEPTNGQCPNMNDALLRVKGGSELVALSIGQRL